MSLSYGTLPKGQTQQIVDGVEPDSKPAMTCCGACPFMVCGITLVALTATVPATCTTHISEVFAGLGAIYIALAVLLCGAAQCGGGLITDQLKQSSSARNHESPELEA